MDKKVSAKEIIQKVDLKKDLNQNIEIQEPILKDNPNRFVLFPKSHTKDSLKKPCSIPKW